MNNHAIQTVKLTDRQIVDLIIAIRDDIGFDGATIRFGAGVSENIDPNTDESKLKEYKGNSHGILSFDVGVDQSVEILFRRGICSDSNNPDQGRQSSSYFDEIFVRRPGNAQTIAGSALIIKLLKVIEGALPGVPRALRGQGQDVIATLRAEMSALDETYRRMLERFEDERTRFLKGFEEQRQSVEEERQTAKAKLEAEAEQRQQEFQSHVESEETKLSQRQTELDAREQELDDRQHMHVRRKLREDIIKEYKRREDAPIVPKRAEKMRWGVFLMSFVAGVGLVGFGLWTFYLLLNDGFSIATLIVGSSKQAASTSLSASSYWVLVARGTVSSLVGSGLFFYAIRWLRSIYLEDVRTIRHYDSYRDDIDRASFAIETIMEISNEKEGMTAPDAWIEGVCRNLFRSDVGNKAENGQQADAFIELLRSFSSASVGPNGAEVTFDRKSGKRLAKTISARGE